MVIARTKMVIQDDLLKPWPKATVSYAGPNAERFYKEIPKLLQSVFRVHPGDIQEKKFSWSKGEPEKFSVKWEMDKNLDRNSYYQVTVELKGTGGKEGKAEIVVDGALRTEYPQDTVWERSLLYEFLRVFWHRIFYWSKREQMIREGSRLLAVYLENLKRLAHQKE
ncbi:MAG: hypothetical protein QXU82_02620 [Candidatus Aenigmatarchaeota archaeon]